MYKSTNMDTNRHNNVTINIILQVPQIKNCKSINENTSY